MTTTLSRRMLLASGTAALLTASMGRAAPRAAAASDDWYSRAIIIDGLGAFADRHAPDGQLRLSDAGFAEARSTGVTALNVTVGPVGNAPDTWQQMLDGLEGWDSILSANPDRMAAIRSVADLRAAKASGRFGIIYGTQDTAMIGNSLDRLAELKTRGVRVVQLTYNLRNLSGDGALEPGDAGLSRLGRSTIARIEAEKLLLDLSHGGARTMAEAIAAATRPPTISHTGCRALFDHPRNTNDATLRALADKGGVAGVYFMPYLSSSYHPTGAELIAHIEHMANICGEDHVAIGSDNGPIPIPVNAETLAAAAADYERRRAAGFAAPGEGPDVMTLVADYNSLDRFQRLSAALSRRGWTQARLEKLFGGNLLRLYGEVWA
jgi:membrane dipeptidase